MSNTFQDFLMWGGEGWREGGEGEGRGGGGGVAMAGPEVLVHFSLVDSPDYLTGVWPLAVILLLKFSCNFLLLTKPADLHLCGFIYV